jgi:hypothetical protein
MRKAFGEAKDFYRVRLIEVWEEKPAEFDWKEGASYFPPPVEKGQSLKAYRLEVVEIDSGKCYPLKSFREEQKDIANQVLAEIEEDLENLTNNEFVDKYDFLPKEDTP